MLCCYKCVTSTYSDSNNGVFLDFFKAFDNVDHLLIVIKLSNSALNQRLDRVLRKILVNLIQNIKLGSAKSDTVYFTSGVSGYSAPSCFAFIVYKRSSKLAVWEYYLSVDWGSQIEFIKLKFYLKQSRTNTKILCRKHNVVKSLNMQYTVLNETALSRAIRLAAQPWLLLCASIILIKW